MKSKWFERYATKRPPDFKGDVPELDRSRKSFYSRLRQGDARRLRPNALRCVLGLALLFSPVNVWAWPLAYKTSGPYETRCAECNTCDGLPVSTEPDNENQSQGEHRHGVLPPSYFLFVGAAALAGLCVGLCLCWRAGVWR